MALISAKTPQTKKDIRREIAWLAFPAIGEMMLQMIVSMTDVAFVGRLGANELAAIGIATNIFFTLLFIFAAIGVGATAIIARAFGAGDAKQANYVAGQAFTLGLGIAAVASLLGFFYAESLMGFFSRDPEVIAHGVAYLEVVALPSVFMLVYFVMRGVVIGSGNTKLPLLLAVLISIINITGNYVLIYGKWGFPRLGVAGAAWSTSLSLSVASLILIAVMFSGKIRVHLQFRDVIRPHWQTMKRILRLSIPAQLEELMRGGGNLLVTLIISLSMGALAYAAHTVAISVESLSFMPGIGFAIASTALVGQALGAKLHERAERIGWEATKMTVAVMSVFGLTFLVLSEPIVRLFTNDATVIPIAALLIKISALEQPLMALEFVLAGALRGAGDTRWALYITLIGNWCIRIPGLLLVVFVFGGGIYAIWVVFVIDWLIRASIAVWRFRSGKWKTIDV
ncbi:MATE family efflux transporter [Numidum massiliense]|uniref:MATE family efflux transporter n=1 Tax=Numidum massiliense TaxID=1522315 RepID=UPI0006D597A5|nr:MATE family efflux transporter [Numidum massiliense]